MSTVWALAYDDRLAQPPTDHTTATTTIDPIPISSFATELTLKLTNPNPNPNPNPKPGDSSFGSFS